MNLRIIQLVSRGVSLGLCWLLGKLGSTVTMDDLYAQVEIAITALGVLVGVVLDLYLSHRQKKQLSVKL